jgi:predicted metal-dependent HD superfamily phosphohydrolase
MPGPIDGDLTAHWRALVQSIDASAHSAPNVEADLLARLGEPHRAYHNGRHILALLKHAAAAEALITDPDAVRLAIWFHDIIYDPRAKDNEEASAQLAQTVIAKWPAASARCDAVVQMIRATAGHGLPDGASQDCALFLDFDLAILGAPQPVYDAYANAIRAEYAFVPGEAYHAARCGVLRHFLNRTRLYFTDYGRTLWEETARGNLAREIALLELRE